MYTKKHQRESRQSKFWKRARAICNLHSSYNFALVLHENTLVFSKSEAHNFFSCTLLWTLHEVYMMTYQVHEPDVTPWRDKQFRLHLLTLMMTSAYVPETLVSVTANIRYYSDLENSAKWCCLTSRFKKLSAFLNPLADCFWAMLFWTRMINSNLGYKLLIASVKAKCKVVWEVTFPLPLIFFRKNGMQWCTIKKIWRLWEEISLNLKWNRTGKIWKKFK